jgi:uncharacterized phiE125 gp8 family phage protein
MAQLNNIEVNPVSAPVGSVVTLAQIKKQLRIESDFTEEDDLLEEYISAAVGYAEDYISGHIFDKAVTLTYSGFNPSMIFEIYPVRSITSVEYYKEGEDVLTLMDPADYYLRNLNLRVQEVAFKEIPVDVADRPDAVKIILQAGYPNTTNTPKTIKQAIMLIVADLYNYREDRKEVIHKASHQLLRPYRKYI